MANDEHNNRNKRGDAADGEVGRELLKLVGRFILDFGRLSGKAIWQTYRRISGGEGQRQPDDATKADEPNTFSKLFGIAQHQIRGKHDATVPETREPTQNTPPKRDRPPADNDSYLDRSAVQDEEAAALLEDLLRETEADMRQRQAENTADEATAIPATPEKPAQDTPSEETSISVEEQLRQRAEALQEAQRLNPDAAPPTPEVIEAEDKTLDDTDEPQPPAITYNTPEETARIKAKLRAKEALAEQERHARAAKAAAEEAEQQRLQETMEADKARIRAEQEARAARFEEAERQRKAREAELRRARLADDIPDDNDQRDDNTPNQQTTNSED